LPDISFITKSGCHLCEEAEVVLRQICNELGLEYSKIFIEENPDLALKFQEEIPVVLIDGIQHSAWRLDPVKLRAALAK
jgi:glutaredoxin